MTHLSPHATDLTTESSAAFGQSTLILMEIIRVGGVRDSGLGCKGLGCKDACHMV